MRTLHFVSLVNEHWYTIPLGAIGLVMIRAMASSGSVSCCRRKYTFPRRRGESEGGGNCGTKLVEGTVTSKVTRAYWRTNETLLYEFPILTVKSKRQNVQRLL